MPAAKTGGKKRGRKPKNKKIPKDIVSRISLNLFEGKLKNKSIIVVQKFNVVA